MNPITDIRVGDVLTRPKTLGITHVGVVVGPNLIFQNTPIKGEHLTTLQDFSAGKPISVRRTGVNPSLIVARTQAALVSPKKYDVFRNNCEHTVTEVTQGVSKSPQLAFFQSQH